jgi:hypothetical protein
LQYIIKETFDIRFPATDPFQIIEHFRGKNYICNASDGMKHEILATATFKDGNFYEGIQVEPSSNITSKISFAKNGYTVKEIENMIYRSLKQEISKYNSN